YDAWYDVHAEAYETELAAIRRLLLGYPRILEVGVGTGRFASRLGVRLGLEPSLSMAKLAKARGVRVVQGRAERMPFRSASVDAILMVTTLCSVREPAKALSESARALCLGGVLVLADIDPGSFLGPIYQARRAVSPFLRRPRFHAVGQIRAWLAESGFTDLEVWQTLFHRPEEVTGVEPLKKGHGEGGIVIFRARRIGKNASRRRSRFAPKFAPGAKCTVEGT
ncbi:MAG TPA: class I SAM-dependent methyltransferase, partial [Thermoplasmata archaeon]|nr:class I SAM-dependent methyltransferase [Thermoplasmata archaeon]